MRSLRGRLGVSLGLIGLGSVALMALLSIGLLRRFAIENTRADLRRLAAGLAGDPDTLGDERLGLAGLRHVLAINGDIEAVIGPGGGARGSGATLVPSIDLGPLLAGDEITGTVGDHVYVGVPVRFAGRAGVRGVIIARPIRAAREVTSSAIARVALAAALALLAAIGVSTLVARRLVRPVADLSAATHRITHGHLGEQIPVTSDDELGALAHAFNAMSVSLGEAQRREREFLASVSHELRTPITSIRGYAEAIADGAVRDEQGRAQAIAIIRAETERLERMVTDVMDLARLGQKEFALDVRRLDIVPVLRASLAALNGAAGVTYEAAEPVELETDADRVCQIVSNLVQNALRVTPGGGSVEVRARRSGDGGAVLEVADTGPGIAEADLPHVFERSYLWRASKGERPVGTGLGLAIVRELVTRLGGQVEVESRLGVGSTFRVTLPARAPVSSHA